MMEPHVSNSKPHPFMDNNVLYACPSNTQALQQQMANDNRMLWAALTPHGTRHFISEPFPIHEEHYEVINYAMKEPAHDSPTIKRTPVKVCMVIAVFDKSKRSAKLVQSCIYLAGK